MKRLTAAAQHLLTQPVLYDRDGAVQLLDGLAVLEIQAVCQT